MRVAAIGLEGVESVPGPGSAATGDRLRLGPRNAHGPKPADAAGLSLMHMHQAFGRTREVVPAAARLLPAIPRSTCGCSPTWMAMSSSRAPATGS
jgi:hypothetical protein